MNTKLLYFSTVVAIFLSVYFFPTKFNNISRELILGIWVIIFILERNASIKSLRIKNVKEKIVYVSLIIIVYYILYFLIGIIIGFQKNPYSQKINILIVNIILILGVKLIQEFIRTKLLIEKNNKIDYIFITIIFGFVNIQINDIEFSNIENIVKFVSQSVILELARSTLLTYLSINGGYKLNYIYIIPSTLVILVSPIIPKIDWFISTVAELVVFLVIFISINYMNNIKERKIKRKELRKISPLRTIPIIIVIVIFVSFVAGLLKYKPIAVMSQSMYPYFKRGDVLILQKISKDDIEELNVNDVISYKLESISITHRIVKIERSYKGEYIFTTKGDNNSSEDVKKVTEEQIEGIMKLKVPVIGYPTVIVNELIININK